MNSDPTLEKENPSTLASEVVLPSGARPPATPTATPRPPARPPRPPRARASLRGLSPNPALIFCSDRRLEGERGDRRVGDRSVKLDGGARRPRPHRRRVHGALQNAVL